ncbi:MAG: ATP-binding domain-containing protein, partial [Actinomycetota bacterium]
TVAAAIQRGDADATVAALRDADDVDWYAGEVTEVDLSAVRAAIVRANQPVLAAAADGDAAAALAGLEQLRVLCAHRSGSAGVQGWVERIEAWLVSDLPDLPLRGSNYPGRPVLITANDRRLHLANGDVGVVVRNDEQRPVVALPAHDGDGVRTLAPGRLPPTETVHAMTVHKSQGSQFAHVVLVLPDEGSPLLTRELVYTGLTRGRHRATVIGSERAVRTAVATRAVRASGLSQALRLGC